MSSVYDWSTTAANNGSIDSQMPWPEGMARRQVNDSARQLVARVAELLGDLGGALAAGGTANGLTVTANSAFTTLADGRIIAFRATADNTGAATLNVNSIGAKAIRKMDSTGDVALVAGEIQSTGIYLAQYSAALNGAAGAWLLVNPTIALAGFVTLTGTQTLTNKTLTSPTINTPTITGGTSASMTLTGAALNGTLGATTPSTVVGTTGTFSGVIVGSSSVTSSQVFASSSAVAVLGTTGSGNIFLRPNGTASSANQVSIDPSGDVIINGTLTVTG